jgi:hypothetical protein
LRISDCARLAATRGLRIERRNGTAFTAEDAEIAERGGNGGNGLTEGLRD